jgi:hypothetical protein
VKSAKFLAPQLFTDCDVNKPGLEQRKRLSFQSFVGMPYALLENDFENVNEAE